MTTVPRDLTRKQPANASGRLDAEGPPHRGGARVIDGTAWERVGIVSGRGMAWFVFCLLFGVGFVGFLLSLITQNA